MLTNTPTVELLSRALDVAALRQSVYSANIANASVEGYRRMEVSFDKALEQVALTLTQGSSRNDTPFASAATPQVIATDESVRLDEEMALMAKNALRYQTLVAAFERSMGTLQMAIREGRE